MTISKSVEEALLVKRIKKIRKKIHEDVHLLFAGKPLLLRKTLWLIVIVLLIDILFKAFNKK